MVAALAWELNQRLSRARLRAVRLRREGRELTLYFREGTLHWDLHPRNGGVTFGPSSEPGSGARPLQATVQEVNSPPDERILQIHLLKARGRPRPLRVVVELLTNQWNAFVLEGDEGRIRHALWVRRTEGRVLAPGAAYALPEISAREGVEEPLSPDRWKALLVEGQKQGGSSFLLQNLAYASPLNLPALLGEHLQNPPPEARQDEGYRIWRALRDPLRSKPCILHTPEGPHPYPMPLPTFRTTPKATLLEAVGETAGKRDPTGPILEEILDHLDRAIRQEGGRIEALGRQLREATEPDTLRETATLILSRLEDIPKGESSVALTGFDGTPVEIELDPSLSPQENADALYREAGRRERARDRLPGLLDATTARLQKLKSFRAGLSEGTLDPEEVRGKVPGFSREAPREESRDERLPYRRFRSSGGLEIRVGRGARDNDELTFRHSHPEEVWLHARDGAGAHVVLRWKKPGNPPGRDLAEAAILAVLNSRMRSTATAPVDWTRRKYVRKPRRTPPGTVVADRVQTLFVEVDPQLPERLRWDR
ncbi:NFACT RNA binding domain-containing protein [Gemmatimonadota bacterium]